MSIRRRNRDTLKSQAEGGNGAETAEEAELRQQAQLEERRRQSSALVGESIKRELASKEAGEKFPEVDDTDGQDPEAEFEAWKLRELMRLKREREADNAWVHCAQLSSKLTTRCADARKSEKQSKQDERYPRLCG